MIYYKTEEEIRIMQEAGDKLKRVMKKLLPQIRSGMTTSAIDVEAERLIKEEGGESSFKKVKGYYWSTCLTINEQVVHTPPSDRVLKKGDLLTIDIGLFFKGFHVDYATSLIIEEKNEEKEKFLQAGKEALNKAIKEVKIDNYLGKISEAIENTIYVKGYFILKQLTGHGVGRQLHEDPHIPGFVDKPIEKTIKIRPGLTIAIEVIYSMGTEEFINEKGSNWSVITKDRSLSACFEHTVAVSESGVKIIT